MEGTPSSRGPSPVPPRRKAGQPTLGQICPRALRHEELTRQLQERQAEFAEAQRVAMGRVQALSSEGDDQEDESQSYRRLQEKIELLARLKEQELELQNLRDRVEKHPGITAQELERWAEAPSAAREKAISDYLRRREMTRKLSLRGPSAAAAAAAAAPGRRSST
eukprot:RCo051345